MAPKTSKSATSVPLEKLAWRWAETTEPGAMTDANVREAYRLSLKPCSHTTNRRNCRGNPRCLFGIGERQWHVDILDSYWYNGPDPDGERRKEGEHCGLRNFGATCYVNTLLQVWYHNPKLRQAVYRFVDGQEHSSDDEYYCPLSVCGQLQLIFAMMERSVRKSVDPLSFINALGLDTMQQQDAHEFSKLFMSLLSNALSKQPDETVRTVVRDEFCGLYKYATTCKTCGFVSERTSEFYELDLNVRGNKDLPACLREFLKEEKLDGENQYACARCEKKRDATRRILLTRLPRTLNCQLLRFVYDRNSQQKKKLNSTIQFPEVLDMSPYLEGAPSGDFVYQLCAVLIHRGSTAYSGHYIAHIRHRGQGHTAGEGQGSFLGPEVEKTKADVWYKYNDELVEKMKGSKLQLGVEEELLDTPKQNGDDIGEPSAKKPRLSKGFHSSQNAYMLVYRRETPASQPLQDGVSRIPDHVTRTVEADNRKFEAWCEEEKKKKVEAISNGHGKQRAILKTYSRLAAVNGTNPNQAAVDGTNPSRLALDEGTNPSRLAANEGTDPSHQAANDRTKTEYMGVDWLAKYFTDPDTCEGIHNTSFLCTHGRLDVDQAGQMKLVNAEMAGELYDRYGGGPRITSEMLCRDCVTSRCRTMRLKWRITSDQQLVTELLKRQAEHCDHGYWVGKQSLRNWKSYAVRTIERDEKANRVSNNDVINEADDDDDEKPDFNDDVVCEQHGELTVDESSRRVVSEALWSLFKFYFPLAKEVKTDRPMCEQCQFEAAVVADERDKNRQLAQQYRQLLPDLYANRKRPRYDVIVTDDVVKVDDVAAQVRQKIISEEATIRRSGSSVETSSNVVTSSNSATSSNSVTSSKSVTSSDKLTSSNIVTSSSSATSKADLVTSSSSVTSYEAMTSLNGVTSPGVVSYFAVSHDKLEEWRKFVRSQGKCGLLRLPGNERFLCEHGKLTRPLVSYTNWFSDQEPRASLLYADEWSVLSSLLPSVTSQPVRLTVSRSAGTATYSVNPDVCAKCRMDGSLTIQSYANATVYVHRLPNDNSSGGQNLTDQSEPSVAQSTNQNAAWDHPIRRSHRAKRSRDDLEIKVDSTDTIREVKVKLMNLIQIAPFDQHLYLSGDELTDESWTLTKFGITPNCVLHLKVDEPDEKNNVYWPQDATSLGVCPEEGFKGTGLLGVQ